MKETDFRQAVPKKTEVPVNPHEDPARASIIDLIVRRFEREEAKPTPGLDAMRRLIKQEESKRKK